jgi:hypothetical protein
MQEVRMRMILILAAGAIALAGCATPTTTAANGASQQTVGVNLRDEPPAPATLRRPPPTLKNWAAAGSGGMC